MQYFVVWPDGQKFGPADVTLLSQWVTEGRITADTTLESVIDGARVKASQVDGLNFASQSQPQATAEPVQQPVDTSDQFSTSDPSLATSSSYVARYYVLGDGGHKFGPADNATLTQWASEGRLLPSSTLEHEVTGLREQANQVSGIIFPLGAAGPTSDTSVSPSSPYGASASSNYPREEFADTNAGQTEAIISIVLGVLGTCCCCLLPIIGIFLGMSAQKKGNALGKTAVIVNIVCFILSIIFGVISVMTNPAILDRLRL